MPPPISDNSRPSSARLFDSQDQWSANGKIEEALAATIPAAQMKKIRDLRSSAQSMTSTLSIEREPHHGRRAKGQPKTPSDLRDPRTGRRKRFRAGA